MDTSEAVLGHYAATRLTLRIAAPVLIVGRDRFTKGELARVECFNYLACARLERALRDLQAESVRHVFETIPPAALARPGVGVISFACLGAAFEARHIGGDHPLVAWCRQHFKGAVLTVGALKASLPSTTARARRRRR